MKVIVGLSPRGTSLSRIMSWTVAYMDQCMQEHRLQKHGMQEQRLQEHLLEQQQHASKVTKPQAVKKVGGKLSPCNTEDDCFATSRSLDRDVARWRLPATRLRFRPKSRISRSLVATRLRFRPKSRISRSLVATRLRFRPKSRISRSLVATRLRFRPKSRISRSLVATRLRFRPKSRSRRSLGEQPVRL